MHPLNRHMLPISKCTYPNTKYTQKKTKQIYMRHWQLILTKLGLYFSSVITLDIDDFFLWRTSFWSIEGKTYKKVEGNPFKTCSWKPPRKSKHSCLYTSETHWQFTGILPIYNGRHASSKYLNIATSGEKTPGSFF